MDQYAKKFNEFTSKYFNPMGHKGAGELDEALLQWLEAGKSQVQNMLGANGLINNHYSVHGAHIPEYPLLTNIIPSFTAFKVRRHEVQLCDALFFSYRNSQIERMKKLKSETKNPLNWFREGHQLLLSIPFFLLYLLGFLNKKNLIALEENDAFKKLNAFISLITFLSSIVTIVQGYTYVSGIWRALLRFFSMVNS